MSNAELREFCTQMIGKFKLLSDIQKEMQYETIDAKFTEWELKKLIFSLNVLREEVRKYVDTADTPQTDRQLLEGKRWTDALTTEEKKCMLDALDFTDTPQTDCDDRYAIRTDNGEVVAYVCPLSCEQTDCGWK